MIFEAFCTSLKNLQDHEDFFLFLVYFEIIMHRLTKSEGIMGHYKNRNIFSPKAFKGPKKKNGKETDEDISIN